MSIIHNYKVLEKIGQGQFSIVYRGIHEKRGDVVAIKCEPQNTPFKLLKRETTILNLIYHKQYIPPILWFGKHQMYHVLVIPYYSMSLETYVIQKLFPAQSPQHIVQHLYQNMLDILEHIHSKSVVHRDLKPQNMMIHENRLLLIDFGLATFTVDEKGEKLETSTPTHEHITGNPKFASIHTHDGWSISPKDENISAFYILLWMVYGQLPWSLRMQVSSTDDVTHVSHPHNVYMRECKQWEYICEWITCHTPLDQNVDYWTEDIFGKLKCLL